MLCWNRSWAVLRDCTVTLSEHCQTLVTNNVIPPTAATSRQFESVCVGSLRDSISIARVSLHFRLVRDSDFSSKRYHVCKQNITKNWHQVQEALPADSILLLQAYTGHREQVVNQYLLQHTHTHTHTHTLTHIHSHSHTHTTLTRPHTQSHTHSQARKRTHSLTHSHTLTQTHSLSYTHTHTHSHTHSLTHTHTHSLTHTHTFTHTHSQTFSHTHTHTHQIFVLNKTFLNLNSSYILHKHKHNFRLICWNFL